MRKSKLDGYSDASRKEILANRTIKSLHYGSLAALGGSFFFIIFAIVLLTAYGDELWRGWIVFGLGLGAFICLVLSSYMAQKASILDNERVASMMKTISRQH